MYGIAPFDTEFGRLLELFLREFIVQILFKSAHELDCNEITTIYYVAYL